MGGIIWDHEGTILYIYAQHLGHDTNNSIELTTLLEGLHITVCNGYNMIVIEGDSTIIIDNYQRIMSRTPPAKTLCS